MLTRSRWARSFLAAGLLAAGLSITPAAADTPDPSPWPQTAGTDPGIDTTAHSLRIAGADRTQTALSSALLLRGRGTYPFGTADRTAGGGTSLATADAWWGLGTCPYAVIVTAGDTAADSLAAASLSDPTDRSSEPRLTRTAARNTVLDRIGVTARVDTDSAPIVVTASARQGATSLSPAARAAVADLADGGCRTVDAAIIVGGSGAVPAPVDQQLVGLGVDQVFRVAGEDRFGTARAIAAALGTGEAPAPGTRCADPTVADGDARMGWYGNAAVELRTSPNTCAVLGRTVVITDGITGADALAAGWWTSTWQVPVLLVDGDGDLPPATVEALNSLVIDNVVVLGGRARVPEETVSQVERITGAASHRIAGADRYETSVQMAAAFGGWFPTGAGPDHDGSMVCLAASSGTGAGSVGWPDALGAGPWCAEAGGPASGVPAPQRGLPPVSGPNHRVTRSLEPSHDAVPVLLTPAGVDGLARPVADLLGGTFDPAEVWCSSIQANDACLDPGFVVGFGGTAVLTDAAVRQAARAVSGQTYVVFDDQAPSAEPGFWTELDMRPVYGHGGVVEAEEAGRACADRASLVGVRWLAAYADLATAEFLAEHDLLSARRYATASSPGSNAPVCVRVPSSPGGLVNALGTSISGRTTTVGVFDLSAERRFRLSGPVTQEGAEVVEGADTTLDEPDGGDTRITFSDAALTGTVVTMGGEPATLTAATVDILLQRGPTPEQPDTFEATVSMTTSAGTVLATATGEARLIEDTWHLRGRSTITGGSWGATVGTGGFTADLGVGDEGGSDDQLRWRSDALLG